MSEFIRKKENEVNFWLGWNELVSSLVLSPRYLEFSIRNYLVIASSRNFLVSDESFIYIKDGKVVGAAFLPIEKNEDGNKSISFCESYVHGPIFKNIDHGKDIFTEIDRIAKELAISKCMFYLDPLNRHLVQYNYLQYFGYLGTSLLSYFIDLSFDDLLRNCRKGHISDIKKIKTDNNITVSVFDKTGKFEEAHANYCRIHEQAAGYKTRPDESFNLQKKALMDGEAILVEVARKGIPIASAYFDFHASLALYASSAVLPEHENEPLSHLVVFEAMEYLKKKGILLIDVSQPVSPSPQFDYYPDKKQLNIGRFKRGFGGHFVDYYRGIKYFDRGIFLKDVDTFREKYII